ncbi:hypothetical protein DMB92_06355 [Campylobacter sp. MIT 99-7217]|uniref:hypothetical protein n=1 Tax=Campylobacter sp. MIT 99-7217 TaxID=535091 RepID=UPI0011597DD7|nr:hypothetical protein [Campylobacter sp. MIT 99-7217]TQR31309.1 hypothetical protein DMB92_06355 [Campylobacter sp. MIT 99-7217]
MSEIYADINQLQAKRKVLFKRIKTAKFLGFLEGFAFFVLAYYFCKDVVISIALAALFAVAFFRLFTQRILREKNILDAQILGLFLQKNEAKFSDETCKGFDLAEFEIKDFKANNALEFRDFFLFDVSFKNASNELFLGVLMSLKGGHFKKRESLEENELFKKLKEPNFNTSKLYIKNNLALIPSLSNPFFISNNLSVEENFKQMNANLAKLEELILK